MLEINCMIIVMIQYDYFSELKNFVLINTDLMFLYVR